MLPAQSTPADDSQQFCAGAQVAVLLPLPVESAYDYKVPEGAAFAAGDIVEVPLGRRFEVGVVWGAGDGTFDAAKLRASFGGYESSFSESARVAPTMLGRNEYTRTLILHGTSDHVIYPAFDRMAAEVFADHVGPFLLRDCGHFVPWEAPHQLVSGTTAFCGDLLARR